MASRLSVAIPRSQLIGMREEPAFPSTRKRTPCRDHPTSRLPSISLMSCPCSYPATVNIRSMAAALAVPVVWPFVGLCHHEVLPFFAPARSGIFSRSTALVRPGSIDHLLSKWIYPSLLWPRVWPSYVPREFERDQPVADSTRPSPSAPYSA